MAAYFQCKTIAGKHVAIKFDSIDPVTPIPEADFVTGDIVDPRFGVQGVFIFQYTGTPTNGSTDGTLIGVGDAVISSQARASMELDVGTTSGFSPSSSFIALHSNNADAGPFVDVSANFSQGSGQDDLLPGVTTDDSIYIGFENPFVGVDFFNMLTAMVLGGGAISVSYWDGSAWQDLPHMETDWVDHTSEGMNIFINNTDFTIRNPKPSDWALKTLDGDSNYWLEIKVTTGITTSPALEFFQIEQDRIRLAPDGTLEYFGAIQPTETLSFQYFYDLSGQLAINHEVNPSSNTSLELLNNQLSNGALDGTGNKFMVPEGLDTTQPVRVIVKWAPDTNNSGDVELELNINVRAESGALLDGSGITITNKIIESVLSTTLEVEHSTEFLVDIQTAIAKGVLQFVILRDATAGNPDDTLSGDIYINDIEFIYKRWK